MNRLKEQGKEWAVYSLRMAIASSLAIYTAHMFGLQFETQAGVICIFSMLSTAKDTLKLSVSRLVSFIITAITALLAFYFLHSDWLAFGLYIFVTILFSEMMGWGAALSANVVAGTHFLSVESFSHDVVINEFYIVLIGIVFAVVFNALRNTKSQRNQLQDCIEDVQYRMKEVLGGIADYLASEGSLNQVWGQINELQDVLDTYIQKAADYEGNSFQTDSHYYLHYFEMRISQCDILESLHDKLRKMRYMPEQSIIIVEFILYLYKFITEDNHPEIQLKYVEELFAHMKEHEPLPKTREEFETRSVLHHILMDFEEFLLVKKRFVEGNCTKGDV